MASEALQAQAQAQATVRAAPTAAEKKIVEKKGGKNSPRGPQVLGTGTGTWAGTASEGLDERLALSVVEAIVEFSGEQTPIYSVLSPATLRYAVLRMAISLSLFSSVEDLQSCQLSGFRYFDLRSPASSRYFISQCIALLYSSLFCCVSEAQGDYQKALQVALKACAIEPAAGGARGNRATVSGPFRRSAKSAS